MAGYVGKEVSRENGRRGKGVGGKAQRGTLVWEIGQEQGQLVVNSSSARSLDGDGMMLGTVMWANGRGDQNWLAIGQEGGRLLMGCGMGNVNSVREHAEILTRGMLIKRQDWNVSLGEVLSMHTVGGQAGLCQFPASY